MKTRFNSDGNLPLQKELEMYNLVTISRFAFYDNNIIHKYF